MDPLASVSLEKGPVDRAFAMFQIVFILSLIVAASFSPVELTDTVHFAIFPKTVITFAIEPSVPAVALEVIVIELTSIKL